ncbi:MAG: T9SS type A sorting domain-containing protein [Taibaiella sp.]|jgi:hypothetical protein
MKRVKLLCIIALLCVTTQFTWAQVSLASWDFTNLTGGSGNWGPSPNPPTTSNSNVTVVGLIRGPGVTALATGSAAASAWGGAGFFDNVLTTSQTRDSAISLGNYFTFSISATIGNNLSLSEIGAYNIRRSNTGPAKYKWQYSLDGTSFTNIGVGDSIIAGGNVNSPGNPQPAITLSGIPALQNVPSGTTVTFRIVAWGASGLTGTFYFNSAGTNPTLTINGTISSTPLPLTLISFKGQAENNANVLNWVTANEENVASFELERGTNGSSFDKIATLSAKGNNTATNNHYTYKDVDASTTAYYRLKMIDRDDKANYSDIVVLRKGAIQSTINVYPNPAENTLFIEGLTNNSSYRITDALGREAIPTTAVHAEGALTSINISGLVQGIYFLQLTDDNGMETIRFVKK